MYHRGSPNYHVLVKRHFLFAAKALEQCYHGASFFTVVQDPVERFCSTMNFIACCTDGPACQLLGLSPVAWRVIRDWTIDIQIYYCEEEMLFYSQPD